MRRQRRGARRPDPQGLHEARLAAGKLNRLHAAAATATPPDVRTHPFPRPPLARRRHGAPARLQEHLQPRAAAGRPERRHHCRARPARLRRHAGDAGDALRGSWAAASSATASVLRITGLGGRLRCSSEAQLFLGNAGTAMRPLTAALALLAATQGGDFALSGVPRMHERPDRRPGRRAAPARLRGRLPGTPATRRCACAAGGGGTPHGAPIRVRGDVSSQFLTALLLALPLVAADGEIVVEVEGELISKPYVEITLNLLARFGIAVRPRGLAALRHHPGSAYRSPGRMHVEGDASSASYFVALGAIARRSTRRCASRASAPIRSRATSGFVEAARAMGAEVTGGPAGSRCAAAPWPLKAITLDCNHIPDAAMTLAVMALFAFRQHAPDQHRQLAREGDRPHRRHGGRAAQARRGVVEGADFIEVTPPESAARRRHPHLRRPPRRDVLLAGGLRRPAGAHPRPEVRRQDLPRLLRGAVRPGAHERGGRPGDHHRRPDRSGKGTLASAVAKALGYHFLDSGARVPRHRAAAMRRRGDDDEASLAPRWPPRCPAFHRRRCLAWGRDVTDALRAEDAGAMASKVSVRLPGGARGAAAAAARSGAFRAWWPMGATWAR